MSLAENLKAAKEKTALREYDVTIRETLAMTVTVQAKDRDEAEQIVSDNWRDSEYILDADNFTGVEFEAAPKHRENVRSASGRSEAIL